MKRSLRTTSGMPRANPPLRRTVAGGNWVALGIAGAATAGLCGCGVLDPVPKSQVTMDAPAHAPNPPYADSRTDAAPCESSTLVGDPELRAARCEAIAQINERLQDAATAANASVDFNALSWPVGALALYWKLRDPTKNSLLAPGLAAAGAFGYLNGRIPKQADLSLVAVQTMACAYAESTAYAYTAQELYAPAYAGGLGDDPVAPGLVTSMQNLQAELKAYRQATLLLQLSPRAGKSASPRDSLASALSSSPPGKPGAKAADLQPLWDEVAGWDADASAILDAIQSMRREARLQPLLLRARVSAAEITLRHDLVGQAPAPRNPVDIFKELTAQLQAGAAALAASAPASSATAQGAAVQAASGAGRIAAAVTALDADSKKAWRAYLIERVAPLMHAVADARHWTQDEHAVQRQVADAQRTAFGCTSVLPSVVSKTPPASTPVAVGNGARPDSSVTPPPNTPLPAPTPAASSK